ncbi:MAG: shikimate dehydrogenase [Balneolaceae bacterium]
MAFSFDEFKKSSISQEPHYVVVGHPLGHTFSPLMHTAALGHHNINATYSAVDIRPDELTGFIAWMNNENFKGCNITIPYKEQLFNAVDQLDDSVRGIKAINTISKSDSDEIIIGSNTDIYGFSQPLKEHEDFIEGTRAIVFGTGGASKAVLIALEDFGIEEIVWVSRNPARIQKPNSDLIFHIVGYDQWQAFADEASIFVNATPLGMGNVKDKSVLDESDISLVSNKICYDLIYNPEKTFFLKMATKAGATTINGLDMLIHQGSRSFEIWTGNQFPFKQIKGLLSTHLRAK